MTIERSDLLGSWELVSWTLALGGEGRGHPFGPDAQGRLLYAEDQMAAVLARAHRQPLGTRLAARADPARQAEAMVSYVSYAGPWDLEGDRVVHHVELSLFPDWVGTDLVRYAAIEGDHLVLTSEAEPTSAGDAVHTLVWRRVAP